MLRVGELGLFGFHLLDIGSYSSTSVSESDSWGSVSESLDESEISAGKSSYSLDSGFVRLSIVKHLFVNSDKSLVWMSSMIVTECSDSVSESLKGSSDMRSGRSSYSDSFVVGELDRREGVLWFWLGCLRVSKTANAMLFVLSCVGFTLALYCGCGVEVVGDFGGLSLTALVGWGRSGY